MVNADFSDIYTGQHCHACVNIEMHAASIFIAAKQTVNTNTPPGAWAPHTQMCFHTCVTVSDTQMCNLSNVGS